MCVGISPQAHEGTMHRAGAFEPDAIVPVCLPPTVSHYPTTPRLSRELSPPGSESVICCHCEALPLFCHCEERPIFCHFEERQRRGNPTAMRQ
jgi:hypothetical protein